MPTDNPITSVDTLDQLKTRLKGVRGSRIPQVLTGSKTFDPANMASGASQSTTVTVTGAVVGMVALASFPIGANDVMLSAHVSDADTVTVVFLNRNVGALDLASGPLVVDVF